MFRCCFSPFFAPWLPLSSQLEKAVILFHVAAVQAKSIILLSTFQPTIRATPLSTATATWPVLAMISYPRDSSGPHVSSAPSTSESPGNGGTISIGPWPLKGGSFSRKSPGHNCRNSVGPWPLKRSHSSEVKQPHNGPLQIIQDLREVNGGGLSAALKAAVDEEGALGADRAGADDGWPTTRDSKPVSRRDKYLTHFFTC